MDTPCPREPWFPLYVNIGRHMSHSKYVTVSGRGWSLSFPRDSWRAMSLDQRQDVITRQQALFDYMARQNGGQTIPKKNEVHK